MKSYASITPSTLLPMKPFWLILVTMVAGLAASGPIAGAIIHRCGYRKSGWLLGSLLGFFGICIFLFAILWTTEWYWIALSLTAFHLLCGTGLFFALRIPCRRFIETHPLEPRQHGSYREIIVGLIGGALITGLLGIVFMVLYTLFIDELFSTLMPVTFQDSLAGSKVFTGVFFLVIAGAIAGGVTGRFNPRIHPGQMILYSLGLVWAYLTWLMATEISIALPGFQAGAATGSGWGAIAAPYFLFNLLLGFWWSVFLLSFLVSHPGKLGKLGRAIQVAGINLAAGITLSISFGYTADMFLAFGRHFEREGFTERALWSYERGLKKRPADRIASYLQYRAALSNHRLGKRDEAKKGFRRVVAKYTLNEELVKKANRFLDNLDRSEGKKRVVLPGVETPTEYKGSYCVPNSLALAMRYWGSDVTARIIGKRITGLGSGTFVVDQSWFAQQADFRHDFLPMASMEDIKTCIDAGFPVLVYVPEHAFAIVGYDEALETFVTYDVATNDVWVEYIQKDFIKAWKKQATTLILAYPAEKEKLLPENIRHRLQELSDNYLHFQLHYFDAPAGSISIPHLFKAAEGSGDFFFPVTILYAEFPGLRKTISNKYDVKRVSNSIYEYFKDNFDEGVHRAGQYHDERWATPDWSLKFSMQYLIGNNRFDLVKELIHRIDDKGQLSKGMNENMGMIRFAQGEFNSGLDWLRKGEKESLYTALAKLKFGDAQGTISDLVKALSGCT